MAQETGTLILARARIKAQDNDSNSNFAVGAADALILLNDVLVSLSNNLRTKPKWLGATTTGLTFNAGDMSVVTSITADLTEFESFHPAGSASLTYPITPALERVSVQTILEMFGYDGNTALTQSASEWTHVAAEKAQSDTAASGLEKWRVWAYPVINRQRFLTARAPMPVTISAIGDYPELDTVDSRVVSSILAYKIAKLKRESDQGFLNGIIEEIPVEYRQAAYGTAIRASQLHDRVVEVRD